ncbi:MAG TPA: formylglycine-generating enzyme family protein [Armatimonadota bacterium]|nr:formylglycine-generating enzyme family protein [Armatimonadota bacterium]
MNHKLSIITALVILAVGIPVWAVGPTVSNVAASQRADGSNIVDVYYDLADPDTPSLYVGLLVSTDAGTTYSVTPQTFQAGSDIGWGVKPGTRRHIAWRAAADLPKVEGLSYAAKVMADDGPGGAYSGELVHIAAGSFLMGNSGAGDDGKHPSREELPQHSVQLPDYWIGKYEATRGEYRKFIEAGGYSRSAFWSSDGWKWKEAEKGTQPDHWAAQENWGSGTFTQTDKHPVVGVTYYEAEAFCNWAGGRLPTEAQWEKAARWTGSRANVYPWGDVWDKEKCNNSRDSLCPGRQTAPVGSYPAGVSSYGCCDMAGNVWEWCKDWHNWESYTQTPPEGWVDPQGPTTGSYRLLRGGSWYSNNSNYARCASRSYCFFLTPENSWNDAGFRIVRFRP